MKEIYWGKHEGVVQGLFTKVYDSRSQQTSNVTWGIKSATRHVEVSVCEELSRAL